MECLGRASEVLAGGRAGKGNDTPADERVKELLQKHRKLRVANEVEEDTAAKEEVHQAFGQVIQRLCARLDAVDFKLTAALAAGAPWASLEVLRAHRVKLENLGRMNYALQSMTSTIQSFFYEEKEEKNQLKQEWKEHHFALHVYRKHIIESALRLPSAGPRQKAEAALQEQQEISRWSDDEGDTPEVKTDDDVPEIICDLVDPSTLSGLAGFVQYCDPLQTPPVLAAAMVQSLLLVQQTANARTLFEAVFVRSRKTQAMVVAGAIPVDFLSSVKAHRAASVVLRRLLARYESLGRIDLSPHHTTDEHQDITVYCRVSTRSVAKSTSELGGTSQLFQGTSEDADLLRLRKVGERLFSAVFVLHGGISTITAHSTRNLEARHADSAFPRVACVARNRCVWRGVVSVVRREDPRLCLEWDSIKAQHPNAQTSVPLLAAALALFFGLRQLKGLIDGPEESTSALGGSGGAGISAAAGLFAGPTGAHHRWVRWPWLRDGHALARAEAALDAELGEATELRRRVQVLPLDLSEPSSVQHCAALCQQLLSYDGAEMQLAVNHLGHFALVGQLLPLLSQQHARVICVSSLAHRLGHPPRLLQELELGPSDALRYNAWDAYSDSKLANVTYASYAAPVQALLQAARGLLRPLERGANSHVFLAAGADGGLERSGGEYFEESGGDMKPAETHAEAADPLVGDRLWEASERLTGVHYDLGPIRKRDRGSRS
eukprot:g12207.t1